MATILLAALALSAVASLFMCWQYSSRTVELRRMNAQGAAISDIRNRAQGLLAETAEYAKRNPKMQALLDTMKTNAAAGRPPAAPNLPAVPK